MDAGEYKNYTKKERLSIQREVEKLNHRIGGLKTMRRLPDMVFIVDTSLEELAVTEANRLKIPIVGMVDTNANPASIDFVIPSNDDAIRSVKRIVSVIAEAVNEGLRIREVEMVDTGQVSRDELAEMEQYLGPSTLAKLQGVEDDEELEIYDEAELEAELEDETGEIEEELDVPDAEATEETPEAEETAEAEEAEE
jgi:small subunit ribosomal protein S2